MQKKEKILSAVAIIFVIAFMLNYALVLLTNTSKIVGEFELYTISDSTGTVLYAGESYDCDTREVHIYSDVSIIFDKNGYFSTLNFKNELTGTYEVERSIFYIDDLM